MITRWRVAVGLISLVLAAASPVGAHSALIRANPSPNAVSSRPPEEIRLWFSEALEPEFSRITLRDSQGNPVGTMPSQVAAEDHEQMFLIPGQLPDGLYTVVWSAVSAVDAHQTQGSFAFTVGAATGAPAGNVEAGETEALPLDAALIRWFGLLSMAVSVGSLGFWLFVWSPVMNDSRPDLSVPIRRAIWVGWGLLGISAVLTLALQAATVTGAPLTSALVQPQLGALMNNTRFGSLWLVRMALWLSMGIALLIARRDRWFDGAALLVGAGILLTTSLYSHADAARDEVVSVAADWLHLTATALWVGSLIGFLLVIVRARRDGSSAAPMLASLVAQFSIFARVAVAALAVTGVYMAWLQVGTPDALLTTHYGQALLVKLMLMIPLLTVAGINLVYTQRGLRAGKAIWTLRLRRLVGMEIGLTAGVLLAVGVMTSIAPARSVLAAINSAPTPSQEPYYRLDPGGRRQYARRSANYAGVGWCEYFYGLPVWA